MDRCPAPSPEPALAALYVPSLAGALVVPTEGGMVMPVNDDLLARADNGLPPNSYEASQLIHDLAVALRAALAAQPQPLFEGDLGELVIRLRPVMSGPNGQQVVVYPAPAGSATPTRDGDGG